MFPRTQLAQRLARIDRDRGTVPPPYSARVASESRGTASRRRSLEDLIPDAGEWRRDECVCWELNRQVGAQMDGLHDRLIPVLSGPPRIPIPSAPRSWAANRLLVLDIETCGFAAHPAFMVGALEITGEALTLCQAVARDYSEESALMEWTAGLFDSAGGVITFNGRSFDMRYLRERFAYHRLPALVEPPHLDMLYVARKIWGGGLPNCRLQTIERALFGRTRRGDIPGSAIPHVYHSFVESGDAREIAVVLEHNRLDLITLAEMLAETWHATTNPNHSEERPHGANHD